MLKDPAAERSPFALKIDRSTEEMFNAFLLVRKANSGDPVAQHELGLRYLTGQAFTPDTARAALWIGRASDQEYVPAIYNFGIMQNNGWGTPWDPFAAFLKFRTAARKGLVEGEYMYGLLLTDNLVVARDYPRAYRWIRAAADSGYEFAGQVLKDFEKMGIMAKVNSDTGAVPDDEGAGRDGPPVTRPRPQTRQQSSGLQPVFLDMETDTLADPDDSTLISDALNHDRVGPDSSTPSPPGGMTPDSLDVASLFTAADGGSPEALTLAGRRAAMGWGMEPDTLGASVYYIRAIRCDSRWSPVLLWRLVNAPGYFDHLKNAMLLTGGGRRKAEAGYVWACLVAMGFDRQLTGAQALGYLREAAAEKMPDALIELALCRYSGFWTTADAAKGDSLMDLAARLGSREAEVRAAMSRLRNDPAKGPGPGGIAMLEKWESEGSVLAQVMLGYCYEEGAGADADLPAAVSWYRKAARRGSRLAYDALKRLYDDRRPDDALFRIPDGGE